MDRKEETAGSVRLDQFLTTEHFTLQSARGIVNNELFSRVSIYFMTLSSLLIATAFLAQAPKMEMIFSVFVALAFPAIILLGIFTFSKIVSLTLQDATYIKAINQIRHYYYKADPLAAEYIHLPPYDDLASNNRYGGYSTTFRGNLLSASTAVIIANSIASTILLSVLIVQQFSLTIVGVSPYSAIIFILSYLLHSLIGIALVRPEMKRQDHAPKFPRTSSIDDG